MRYRRIGDTKVSAIGLGAMPLSTPGRPDRDDAIAVIHAALDAGITLIDTADAYTSAADGPGHNERLIADALRGRSETVLVATKGGHIYAENGPWGQNGDPAYLADAARASAAALEVDTIDLYQFHRPDPAVPYADSIGALSDLLDDGVIRMAGISNADIAQIETARGILGERLVSVQNQFSPAFRSSEGEFDHCAEHDIAFLPWSPLGGAAKAADAGTDHSAFATVAAELGVSPQRVVLAWELALQHVAVPIPGSRRPASIRDSAAAADLVLTADQLEALSV
ncbi:aldo/keto reductase [Marisediminicola sp. LYQ85]|uniref:aldo/keto reductase n=1 Tax=Marisediminicola sp. LYQ85 TaxID=3391062 RepID=UPI0039838C2D